MVTAIIALLSVLGYLGGCLRNGIAIVDTPEQQTVLANRMNNLQTNSEEQFRQIKWHNQEVDRKLDVINEKLSQLTGQPAPQPSPFPPNGQDQNMKQPN